MLVGLNRKGLESPLIYRPAAHRMPMGMPALRMRHRNPSHHLRKLSIVTRPQEQMPVIRHQTICRNPYVGSLIGFAENVFKRGIIRRLLKKVWIISRDGDYNAKWADQLMLTPILYQDLKKIDPAIEVHAFETIPEGIKHFANVTGVSGCTAETGSNRRDQERARITSTIRLATFTLPFIPGLFKPSSVPSPQGKLIQSYASIVFGTYDSTDCC